MIAAGTEQYMMDNNETSADLTESSEYIKGGLPECPVDGSYTVGTETSDPTCDVGGAHVLP